MKKHKILVIGDTHFPFHDKKAYKRLLQEIKRERPTHVIQIGDLLDQYIFSKFSRSLEVTAEDDIKVGLESAEKMWRDVKKIVPKAKCFQLLGNHDVRLAKRISEKLPELESLISITDLYKFKGVTLIPSARDYLEIDGIVFIHGYLSKSIDHAKYYNKPVVHGHRHRPIVEYDSPTLWSMDVGFLADRNSLPLSYTQTKLSKWTLCCGVITNGVPKLLPLE